MTIFDTDFQVDDMVILYDGGDFHWSGKVGDMSKTDKIKYNSSDWFNLDENCEDYKFIFVR